MAATATPFLPPQIEAQERANTSKGKSRRLVALRKEPDIGIIPARHLRSKSQCESVTPQQQCVCDVRERENVLQGVRMNTNATARGNNDVGRM
jgi:hypothetical protein